MTLVFIGTVEYNGEEMLKDPNAISFNSVESLFEELRA